MGKLRDTVATYDLLATKVLSFVNEDNVSREVSWVIDQYEQNKINHWNSVVDLGPNGPEEVIDPDLSKQAKYVFTAPTVGSNAELSLPDGKVYENGEESSATTILVAKDGFVDIVDKRRFDYNDLVILKNGVHQDKGTDVFFVSENRIGFSLPLDTDDVIIIRKQVGL